MEPAPGGLRGRSGGSEDPPIENFVDEALPWHPLMGFSVVSMALVGPPGAPCAGTSTCSRTLMNKYAVSMARAELPGRPP